MNVGISTACLFCKTPLENSFGTIKGMGADRVEVFLNSFCEYEEWFARLLRCRADDNGLTVRSVHPMSAQFESQLFSIHDRQRADSISIFKKVLLAGKILGASCYVMHGAAHLSGVAKNLQDERVASTLEELIDIAQEYNITLALENVSWCIYHDADYARMLTGRIKNHRLKYVLDIKQAVRSGTSPFDIIDAVGEDIINVHLCDYAYEDGKLVLKMPGKGCFDFASLFAALKGKGYKGDAFIEVYSDMFENPNELKAPYQFLNNLCSQQR